MYLQRREINKRALDGRGPAGGGRVMRRQKAKRQATMWGGAHRWLATHYTVRARDAPNPRRQIYRCITAD